MSKPGKWQLQGKTVTVRVGFRFFRIHSYLASTKMDRGTVSPIGLHGRDPFDVSTLGFKVYDEDAMQGPLAIVQTISVVQKRHRRGWASDMVRALMIKIYSDQIRAFRR